ncbi:hypothetical protein GGR51DRAFT_512126 [Nemania sp. FL0031]|nr:hypothetical protein GGR51DRAFT_512126 [Nemania sp. FL0031]
MQANLFKILAIAAAFSTVQSAPAETAEGQVTQGQVNGTQANETHANEAHVDEGVQQVCDTKEAPHISTREREGDIFAKRCRDFNCHLHSDCRRMGCRECNLYWDMCGNSWTRCY